MMTKNKDKSQGPPASDPDQVRRYLRERLNKLTSHIKQKSVDHNRLIKADREEDYSGIIAYV
jgi:ribosomal protein S15P/S13E